jgi:hypothetical protein
MAIPFKLNILKQSRAVHELRPASLIGKMSAGRGAVSVDQRTNKAIRMMIGMGTPKNNSKRERMASLRNEYQ